MNSLLTYVFQAILFGCVLVSTSIAQTQQDAAMAYNQASEAKTEAETQNGIARPYLNQTLLYRANLVPQINAEQNPVTKALCLTLLASADVNLGTAQIERTNSNNDLGFGHVNYENGKTEYVFQNWSLAYTRFQQARVRYDDSIMWSDYCICSVDQALVYLQQIDNLLN